MVQLNKEQLEDLGEYLEEKLQFTSPSGKISKEHLVETIASLDGSIRLA